MMEEYITKELPALIQYMNMNNSNGGDGKAGESSFGSGIELNVHGNCSLMGHSMGGHGALTLGMKYRYVWIAGWVLIWIIGWMVLKIGRLWTCLQHWING